MPEHTRGSTGRAKDLMRDVLDGCNNSQPMFHKMLGKVMQTSGHQVPARLSELDIELCKDHIIKAIFEPTLAQTGGGSSS